MKYIFLHIGKTAGTSFRTFLEKNIPNNYFGYGKLWYITNVKDESKFLSVEPRGLKILDQFNLFCEHFSYGLHEHLKTKEYQYITTLREPISRTISAYRYGIDRGWVNYNENIVDWFTNNINELQNYQLNHISNLPKNTPYKDRLEVGLKNLNSDKFLFGFTEKYNEFIDLCCTINGWNPEYQISNTTKAKKHITQEDVDKLNVLLNEEIMFYNEAIKIYNKKYKKYL